MALNRTFPYCKTPLDVPSGVRRRRTLNKLPQAAGNTRKLLARTAPHNPRYCSEDNLLVVSSGQHCCGQYPRHGKVFNRGNRITTPGVSGIPKGQEVVWTSASSRTTVRKQQIPPHQACRRTSIPVKPGRSQTRHSRIGETAARQLVSKPQSYTAHSIPLTRIDREVTAGLELKLTSVQNAFPDSFVSSTQRFAESLRGTKMMFRG